MYIPSIENKGDLLISILFSIFHIIQVSKELHDYFKVANGKGTLCCRILTKEFDMSQGEHKEQCIHFTGLVAEKVAEIVVREFNLKNIDK